MIKLDDPVVFIGYENDSDNYRLYHIDKSKVSVSRDVNYNAKIKAYGVFKKTEDIFEHVFKNFVNNNVINSVLENESTTSERNNNDFEVENSEADESFVSTNDDDLNATLQGENPESEGSQNTDNQLEFQSTRFQPPRYKASSIEPMILRKNPKKKQFED